MLHLPKNARVQLLWLLFGFFAVSPPVHAQAGEGFSIEPPPPWVKKLDNGIYMHVTADGMVTYSDAPPPPAVEVIPDPHLKTKLFYSPGDQASPPVPNVTVERVCAYALAAVGFALSVGFWQISKTRRSAFQSNRQGVCVRETNATIVAAFFQVASYSAIMVLLTVLAWKLL